ncbi:nucleotidyltransferase domain-containing protein [Halosimplex amylolyticum]|uniref:nucleotidyltransferase domain-containing protein n=1 Tax=Halosimplex amylolyticum TaxID=3396616 RepID=UPI003F565014
MTALQTLCRLTAPTGDDEAEIPDSVDWERIMELADKHGVLDHFGAAIADCTAVPDDIQARAQSRRRSQTMRSLRLTTALATVYSGFRTESIRALPYKGPVLSAIAHGDPGSRRYVDIDVLVAPADFERARAVLRSNGYREVERLRGLGETVFEDDETTVDIHQSILPRYLPLSLSRDELWGRRVSVDVGGHTLPALHPIDRFIILSVHGTKHCWYKLAWIHDIATLLATDHADWAAVRDHATELHCLRHVRLACWLAHRRFGVTIPSVLDPTFDPVVPALGERIDERLVSSTASPPTDREQFSVQWHALARRRDRLRYVTRLATIPSEDDIQSISLPNAAAPLYRVVRPARLLAKFGRRAIEDGR